jgi:excisionase family DNA binding protein
MRIPQRFRHLLSGRQDLNLRPLGPETEPGTFARVHTGSHRAASKQDSSRTDPARLSTGSGSVHEMARHLVHPWSTKSEADSAQGEAVKVQQPLLTVAEVAKVLRVCRATVYRLIETGALPHLRIANSIRIRPEDLPAYSGHSS